VRSSQNETIDRILNAETIAVVGASRNPDKYGYIAYQALKAAGKTVYPVNPTARNIDADPCFASLDSLPVTPTAAVFVVPPEPTTAGLELCARLGIPDVWLQPGAEPDDTAKILERLDLNGVFGGPCIMVALKTRPYQLAGC
jgi:predicted CoA-binding protein